MAQNDDFEWLHVGGIAALVRPGTDGTLLILPGAVADAAGWRAVANSLASPLSIAIVNRRGRAPSDPLPDGATVADEVADLQTLMIALEGPFVLLGWSYGGLLAMELATHRADVAGIVLYEPVGAPFVPAAINPIRRAVEANDLDAALTMVVTKVGGGLPEDASVLRETPAWSYLRPLTIPAATELAAINEHEPNYAAYAKLDVPIAIIVGELNQGREPYGSAAARFIDALPNASVVVLPGQGHLAHAEAPAQLAATVDDVLA